jgi:DNA-binding LacI/PurR family transcriptional regulator
VTTYSYPAEAMVRAGIQLMRMRIANPNLPPLKVLLRGELIVRESSKPA